MANRTVKDAHTIHGTNPQYLIEKIIRSRIYECKYWKEQCFALSADLLVDKAVELKYVGGVYSGNIKPTPFLCLILKMLQIQPDKDIIIEFIKQQDYKYVRALGAMYLRLVGDSVECYKYLETLYNDYRKVKSMDKNGSLSLVHMDDFIDTLLNADRVCDIIMPRIQKRQVLEETNLLEPRQSLMDEDLEDIHLSGGEEEEEIEELEEEEERHRHREHRDREHRDDRHRERDTYQRQLREEMERAEATARARRRSKSPRDRDRSRRSRSPRERRRSRSKERRPRSRSRERENRHKSSPDRKKHKSSKTKDRDREDRKYDR